MPFVLSILFNRWKIILPVALLAMAYAYHWNALRMARNEGFELCQQQARIEAGKRIVEMEKSHEQFRSLPALDRCRAFMRDSGLPERHCNE